MHSLRLFLCALALPLSSHASRFDLPEEIEHVDSQGGIESYRLKSNGLRVLLMPNPGLPVATVMITYEVGSRNESIGTTGATHILEHMMFKGTPRFNPELGNSYSLQMEQIGARSNATTWFDRTNYFATVPSEHVSLAIELEADRMRNLRIHEDDLASEMTVVRNEYDRGENNPVRTLIKEIFAAAFMAHPYGHPTIGWESDIENTSTEKLKAFYDKYYWPENAVLTVIGEYDKEQILEEIIDHYGAIPTPPKAIPQVDTVEPPQIGERRVTIHRAGQTGVVMSGFKVPEATHEDWPALILIDQIVGADKTGRLYRALEDKGKARSTFTFAPELRDPGLFIFGAYLTPEATHAEVESIILDEIDRLIGGGVTADELQRAKSVIQAATIYGRDGPYAIANQINSAIASGDWRLYVNRPNQIENVSKEQIQAVAKKYFKGSQRTTGWFIPESTNTLAHRSPGVLRPNYYRDPAVFESHENSSTPELTSIPTKPRVNFAESIQVATVQGIQVVAIDLPIEEVVSFVGSFAAGDMMSPPDQPMLASLTASMLDKGTQKRDRFEIAEVLDGMGADISFSAGAQSLTFSGRFLRQDAGAILDLLAEQLRTPAFDDRVFQTLVTRQRANLMSAIDNTDYRASAELSRQLYTSDHPNYSVELQNLIEGVDSVTTENLRRFHSEYYGSESMRLVFAGDIDFEQLKAAISIAFENWTGGFSYPQEVPAQKPNTSTVQRIFMADKTSVSVHAGYNTGLQRTNPDYLPFMLGNYILGGSFHSRLMSEVRKNRGLTYDIRSFHQGDILTPGHWKLTASFSPPVLEQGLEVTRGLLETWHDQGVAPHEVERAKETLTGSYLVGLSTTGRIASQVHSFMQRGYEAEYIDQYPKDLEDLTSEKVNRAIKDYFDPQAVRTVLAGTILETVDTPTPQGFKRVAIRLDAPDAGWTVSIKEVYETPNEIIVLSELSRTAGMAAQMISTVSDHATVPSSNDRKVMHYVTGKTWTWGANTSDLIFIESKEEISDILDAAERIFEK